MDPWAPINGISLERYAELSAAVTGENDKDKQAAIVANLGVARADWEAASAGWLARMQDMSLMGAVATRYMPLYNAALAKKNGAAPTVGFDDYVAMSGCIPVMGHAAMLAHYKFTEAQWTRIAMGWNQVIPTHPQYMQFGVLVEQEAARIRAGGPPRALTGAGGPPPAAAPAPLHAGQPGGYPGAPHPQAGYPQPGYPPANPYQQQAHFNAQAQQAGAQLGGALNSFGSAVGSFFDGAVGAFATGSRVMVQWTDGNRYPGTVTQPPRQGQMEVAFPDGRRVWVPQGVVSAVY